jgi:hypothetical protein
VYLHFASNQGQWIEIGAKEPFDKCLLASNCLSLAAQAGKGYTLAACQATTQ